MTETLDLIELVDGVTRVVPNIPTPTAETALRESARLFYADTGIWLERLPPIEIRKPTTGYILTPPLQSMIERIERLEVPEGNAQRVLHGASWHFEPPRTLVFEDLPAEGAVLVPRVQLNLALKATEIPCDHANRYHETLTDGALWLVLQQSGMPWAMPEMAEYHRSLFRNAIARQRTEQFTGRRSGSMRVRPQKFI